MSFTKTLIAIAALFSAVTFSYAGEALKVEGSDQDMSGGYVVASKVVAKENGWLVVHRTDGNKPGPVIAHAPLRAGVNTDVSAILTESVKSGDKFMLMLHAEKGGNEIGIFEYSLGAKEDGPIKVDGKLVMAIVSAK